MRHCTLVALLLAAAATLWGQTSAYQDADGNSSLYLMNAKANLIYNVSDSKFAIGYLHEPNETMCGKNDQIRLRDLRKKELYRLNQTPLPPNASDDVKTNYEKQRLLLSTDIALWDAKVNGSHESSVACLAHKFEYGLSFTGKPSTNLSGQIFQNSNSPASVGGGGSIGFHGIGVKPPILMAALVRDGQAPLIRDSSFLVDVEFTRSTFDTVPADSATVTTRHFNGFKVLPTYNAFIVHGETQFLFGVSGGVSHTNNTDDLKKVMVNTTVSQSGDTAIVKQTSAYLGDYKVSTVVPVYADFAIIPVHAEWLSLDIFERANASTTNGYGEGGIGLFVAKPKKPTEVLGGVSASWKDGKSNIAIVAGWSF